MSKSHVKKTNKQASKRGLSIIKPIQDEVGLLSKDLEIYRKIDYPLFCFKYLQSRSFVDCKDGSFFSDFLKRLKDLSDLGWKQISVSHRHAYGMEKLTQEIIKPQLPGIITPDVPLFAFRAVGNNLPFVGFREGNIFHILFIETSFGDIYDHD